MTKHTPGPWHVLEMRGEVVIERGSPPDKAHHGYRIADISYDEPDRKEERLATAALIAAAPDLLYAARWARKMIAETYPQSAVVETLAAAIAKAEGK